MCAMSGKRAAKARLLFVVLKSQIPVDRQDHGGGRSDGGGTCVPRKARDSFTGLQTSSGKEFSLTKEVSDAAFLENWPTASFQAYPKRRQSINWTRMVANCPNAPRSLFSNKCIQSRQHGSQIQIST